MPRPEASIPEQTQSRIEIAGIARRGIDVFDASIIELIPLDRTEHSPDITFSVGNNALTVVRKNLTHVLDGGISLRRSRGSSVTEERKVIVNRKGELAIPLHLVTNYAVNRDGSFAKYFSGEIDVGEEGLSPEEAVMRIPEIVASLRN